MGNGIRQLISDDSKNQPLNPELQRQMNEPMQGKELSPEQQVLDEIKEALRAGELELKGPWGELECAGNTFIHMESFLDVAGISDVAAIPYICDALERMLLKKGLAVITDHEGTSVHRKNCPPSESWIAEDKSKLIALCRAWEKVT